MYPGSGGIRSVGGNRVRKVGSVRKEGSDFLLMISHDSCLCYPLVPVRFGSVLSSLLMISCHVNRLGMVANPVDVTGPLQRPLLPAERDINAGMSGFNAGVVNFLKGEVFHEEV